MIRVERVNGGAPLLQCTESHPWESRVTFNPACALVADRKELSDIVPALPFGAAVRARLEREPALCFVLYRAQGSRTEAFDYTRSSIGLAVFSPDLRLLARCTEPVLRPEHDYEDLGVEDGRITRVGDRYFMLYCAYSSVSTTNRIRIAVASTTDFVRWEKHGLLKGAFNELDNKNAMLFPERIGGKFVLLHRPMDGPDAMSIHWAESDDPLGMWKSRSVLMKPIPNPSFADTWVGGGAPPLRLPDGRYLIIYHIGNRRADGTREYDLGIAIGDPGRREFIVKRDESLLRPETPAETTGDAELGVNNVVFICGAYFHRDHLWFPYTGADSVVLGGRIAREQVNGFCG